LISARLKDIEKVRETIGADSLAYLSTESLYIASKRDELCVACFTGKYPTPLY
jgi:amidophosphoribosyltransferase